MARSCPSAMSVPSGSTARPVETPATRVPLPERSSSVICRPSQLSAIWLRDTAGSGITTSLFSPRPTTVRGRSSVNRSTSSPRRKNTNSGISGLPPGRAIARGPGRAPLPAEAREPGLAEEAGDGGGAERRVGPVRGQGGEGARHQAQPLVELRLRLHLQLHVELAEVDPPPQGDGAAELDLQLLALEPDAVDLPRAPGH